jgi:hypothetical protein
LENSSSSSRQVLNLPTPSAISHEAQCPAVQCLKLRLVADAEETIKRRPSFRYDKIFMTNSAANRAAELATAKMQMIYEMSEKNNSYR